MQRAASNFEDIVIVNIPHRPTGSVKSHKGKPDRKKKTSVSRKTSLKLKQQFALNVIEEALRANSRVFDEKSFSITQSIYFIENPDDNKTNSNRNTNKAKCLSEDLKEFKNDYYKICSVSESLLAIVRYLKHMSVRLLIVKDVSAFVCKSELNTDSQNEFMNDSSHTSCVIHDVGFEKTFYEWCALRYVQSEASQEPRFALIDELFMSKFYASNLLHVTGDEYYAKLTEERDQSDKQRHDQDDRRKTKTNDSTCERTGTDGDRLVLELSPASQPIKNIFLAFEDKLQTGKPPSNSLFELHSPSDRQNENIKTTDSRNLNLQQNCEHSRDDITKQWTTLVESDPCLLSSGFDNKSADHNKMKCFQLNEEEDGSENSNEISLDNQVSYLSLSFDELDQDFGFVSTRETFEKSTSTSDLLDCIQTTSASEDGLSSSYDKLTTSLVENGCREEEFAVISLQAIETDYMKPIPAEKECMRGELASQLTNSLDYDDFYQSMEYYEDSFIEDHCLFTSSLKEEEPVIERLQGFQTYRSAHFIQDDRDMPLRVKAILFDEIEQHASKPCQPHGNLDTLNYDLIIDPHGKDALDILGAEESNLSQIQETESWTFDELCATDDYDNHRKISAHRSKMNNEFLTSIDESFFVVEQKGELFQDTSIELSNCIKTASAELDTENVYYQSNFNNDFYKITFDGSMKLQPEQTPIQPKNCSQANKPFQIQFDTINGQFDFRGNHLQGDDLTKVDLPSKSKLCEREQNQFKTTKGDALINSSSVNNPNVATSKQANAHHKKLLKVISVRFRSTLEEESLFKLFRITTTTTLNDQPESIDLYEFLSANQQKEFSLDYRKMSGEMRLNTVECSPGSVAVIKGEAMDQSVDVIFKSSEREKQTFAFVHEHATDDEMFGGFEDTSSMLLHQQRLCSSEVNILFPQPPCPLRRTISFVFLNEKDEANNYITQLDINRVDKSPRAVSVSEINNISAPRLRSWGHYCSVADIPGECEKKRWSYKLRDVPRRPCHLSFQVLVDPNVKERTDTETVEYKSFLWEKEGHAGDWVLVNCTKDEIATFIALLKQLLRNEKTRKEEKGCAIM